MNTRVLKPDDAAIREAADLIREGKLAAVPGSCFGADGYIRLSYCYADEQLRQSLDRLESFLKTLSQR